MAWAPQVKLVMFCPPQLKCDDGVKGRKWVKEVGVRGIGGFVYRVGG